MKTDLIAPCGINCALCYGFIRPRNKCSGCRAADGDKPVSCTNCKIVACEKRIQNKWSTCAPCDTPCQRFKNLDKRYTSKYHMNLSENISIIKEHGVKYLLTQQNKDYRCAKCGELLCLHREECPSCKAPAWKNESGKKQNGDKKMEKFLYMVFIERGKTYNKMTKAVAERHIENIRNLDNDGNLVLCGAFRKYPGVAGMYIIKAKTLEEAEAICKQEPLVIEGYATYKLRILEVANKENNYLL